jgi:hypothetical protein
MKRKARNTTLLQNPIKKIVERVKIDTPNTQIHDHSHCWLRKGTSIKSGGV